MSDQQNAPMAESEMRRRIRELADDILLDSLISFVAMVHEQKYEQYPVLVIDEFSASLSDMAADARGVLAEVREGVGIGDVFSDEIKKLLEQRRKELRGDNQTISE
jgi:hypothetical protein